MPVRLHPVRSGLTSFAFVVTGSDCAYCWAVSPAVHSSNEDVQAAAPRRPSSATIVMNRSHEIEITMRILGCDPALALARNTDIEAN